MSSLQVFHRFPQLPPELREAIWDIASLRSFVLSVSYVDGLFFEEYTVRLKTLTPTAVALRQTSREACRVFERNNTPLLLTPNSRVPQVAIWANENTILSIGVDSDYDVVLGRLEAPGIPGQIFRTLAVVLTSESILQKALESLADDGYHFKDVIVDFGPRGHLSWDQSLQHGKKTRHSRVIAERYLGEYTSHGSNDNLIGWDKQDFMFRERFEREYSAREPKLCPPSLHLIHWSSSDEF